MCSIYLYVDVLKLQEKAFAYNSVNDGMIELEKKAQSRKDPQPGEILKNLISCSVSRNSKFISHALLL